MLMLDALQSAMRWQKVDPQKEGELWVRVGVDGVPLWKSHVVACTIAVCSDLKDLPMHSPKRHFVFSLLRGTEQKETLENLLKTAQVVDDVAKLDGGTVSINGEKYVVRVFLCGDHMLMYKIAGRDPPACTRDERRPCPYCDCCPADVASFTHPVPPMVASEERIFKSIPCEQLAIDCSHGIVNVLYGVELPVVHTWLAKSGMTQASIERFMETIDVDLAASIEMNTTIGDPLPRSITNALKFFEKHLYNHVITKALVLSIFLTPCKVDNVSRFRCVQICAFCVDIYVFCTEIYAVLRAKLRFSLRFLHLPLHPPSIHPHSQGASSVQASGAI